MELKRRLKLYHSKNLQNYNHEIERIKSTKSRMLLIFPPAIKGKINSKRILSCMKLIHVVGDQLKGTICLRLKNFKNMLNTIYFRDNLTYSPKSYL